MNEIILGFTTQIVTAYVANNTARADQLPMPIREVHRTPATVGEVPTNPTKADLMVEVK